MGSAKWELEWFISIMSTKRRPNLKALIEVWGLILFILIVLFFENSLTLIPLAIRKKLKVEKIL